MQRGRRVCPAVDASAIPVRGVGRGEDWGLDTRFVNEMRRRRSRLSRYALTDVCRASDASLRPYQAFRRMEWVGLAGKPCAGEVRLTGWMDGVEMCAGGSSKHGAHMHRPSHTAHQPHGRCVYPLPLPNPHAMPQAIARWGFERYRRRVRRVSSTLADRADSVERRCVQGVVRRRFRVRMQRVAR